MKFGLFSLYKLKDALQLGGALTLSVIGIWLSSEPITQTIGVVYKFDERFYKPGLGILYQVAERHHRCTMRVSSPFEIFPPYVDPKYICRWSSQSVVEDSLCFSEFDCPPLELVRNLHLVCACLFLLGFMVYCLLWCSRLGRRLRFIAWGTSTLLLLVSFCIAKISAEYLNRQTIEDILDKINQITNNQGAPRIQFETTVSSYGDRYLIARVIFDICSGLGLGFIANGIRKIRWSSRKDKDDPTEEEMHPPPLNL